jgi:uncharacterized protein Yka (UPF0111/DUF47 family)
MLLVRNYADVELRERCAADVDSVERQADASRPKSTVSCTGPSSRRSIASRSRADHAMDDILDLLQDTTETLSLYDVRTIPDEVVRWAKSAHAAASASSMRSLCCRIRDVRNSERRSRPARRSTGSSPMPTGDAGCHVQALSREKDVRELIKLKSIYELLESVSDRCEDVANLIEGIVLESS